MGNSNLYFFWWKLLYCPLSFRNFNHSVLVSKICYILQKKVKYYRVPYLNVSYWASVFDPLQCSSCFCSPLSSPLLALLHGENKINTIDPNTITIILAHIVSPGCSLSEFVVAIVVGRSGLCSDGTMRESNLFDLEAPMLRKFCVLWWETTFWRQG